MKKKKLDIRNQNKKIKKLLSLFRSPVRFCISMIKILYWTKIFYISSSIWTKISWSSSLHKLFFQIIIVGYEKKKNSTIGSLSRIFCPYTLGGENSPSLYHFFFSLLFFKKRKIINNNNTFLPIFLVLLPNLFLSLFLFLFFLLSLYSFFLKKKIKIVK